MQAITVAPGKAGSVDLEERPDPEPGTEELLVEAVALGICGTDLEIVAGEYGWAPDGEARLVLGHESLGRVRRAPPGSGFAEGELVVGIVRRPDPVPCRACAGGEWDMCLNGLYTERGIKQRHGYGSQLWTLDPAFAVKVDPSLGLMGVLLEPTTIVAKGWAHIEAIGGRSRTWAPRKVLVTGAGPVGLLAAMIGRQKGLEVHVLDRIQDGPKPQLVKDLGGAYHFGDVSVIEKIAPDVVFECTGAEPVILEAVRHSARDGIVCLAGVSACGRATTFDLGGFNRRTVLGNNVVFGTVNANRAHYRAAADALAAADRAWLSRLITRRVPLARWREAYERRPGDVKVVIEFDGALG
jgi:threonine dehydrogenase-like Zn-dependent dehydrogenase